MNVVAISATNATKRFGVRQNSAPAGST
jgi:hypothetical protein